MPTIFTIGFLALAAPSQVALHEVAHVTRPTLLGHDARLAFGSHGGLGYCEIRYRAGASPAGMMFDMLAPYTLDLLILIVTSFLRPTAPWAVGLVRAVRIAAATDLINGAFLRNGSDFRLAQRFAQQAGVGSGWEAAAGVASVAGVAAVAWRW